MCQVRDEMDGVENHKEESSREKEEYKGKETEDSF